MTLRHMKIFLTVCKENSISLAAKKLFISQPAVSNAIKELETYYNTPLFDRISKKIYITEAGKKVYEYAIHITSLFDELENSINNNSTSGQIKIGASITIGTHLIPEYINDFSQQFPNIRTYVTIDSSDVIENLILDNQLDLALIEGSIHSDFIESINFINDELVTICGINHPLREKKMVTVSELANEDFLMREKNSGTRELAESILSLHNFTFVPLWESSSTEAIIQGVSKGIGISILPLQLVKDSINKKQVARLEIEGLSFQRQYHIIYHKNKFLSAAALEFMKLCTKGK